MTVSIYAVVIPSLFTVKKKGTANQQPPIMFVAFSNKKKFESNGTTTAENNWNESSDRCIEINGWHATDITNRLGLASRRKLTGTETFGTRANNTTVYAGQHRRRVSETMSAKQSSNHQAEQNNGEKMNCICLHHTTNCRQMRITTDIFVFMIAVWKWKLRSASVHQPTGRSPACVHSVNDKERACLLYYYAVVLVCAVWVVGSATEYSVCVVCMCACWLVCARCDAAILKQFQTRSTHIPSIRSIHESFETFQTLAGTLSSSRLSGHFYSVDFSSYSFLFHLSYVSTLYSTGFEQATLTDFYALDSTRAVCTELPINGLGLGTQSIAWTTNHESMNHEQKSTYIHYTYIKRTYNTDKCTDRTQPILFPIMSVYNNFDSFDTCFAWNCIWRLF